MKRFLTLLNCLIYTSMVHAYDIPEVIGVFRGQQMFADDFCCVGDQNEDGYDDLLVNARSNDRHVNLYYGSRVMDQEEPDFTFTQRFNNHVTCANLNYSGRLLPNRGGFVTFLSLDQNTNPSTHMIDIFELGDEIDNEPEYSMYRIHYNNSIKVRSGHNNIPCDFNSDGYDDLIAYSILDVMWDGKLLVFYGGADFDTIPDWEVYVDSSDAMSATDYSGGYDINGDGFDDILFRTYVQGIYRYNLFLGGEEPDTIPCFRFNQNQNQGRFGPRYMREGFSMFKDVNNDGYDDWGAGWDEFADGFTDDGFFVFFGGSEPDYEPDLVLEGFGGAYVEDGWISGGDVNGDNIGDIITVTKSGTPAHSEIHIHFGSRWINEQADINIDPTEDYDIEDLYIARGLGAIGDYNGDNVDDFVIKDNTNVLILAGNRDWKVGVDDEVIPESYNLSLSTIPNPFNSELTISYDVPVTASYSLDVYDVSGRLIDEVSKGYGVKGNNTATWKSETNGIYFVVLKTDKEVRIEKVVSLK